MFSELGQGGFIEATAKGPVTASGSAMSGNKKRPREISSGRKTSMI
jgi:hypothetical protein